jgi:DNA-binding IscR family transcriptional regulator
MSARPGPCGGYEVTRIPTAISLTVVVRSRENNHH